MSVASEGFTYSARRVRRFSAVPMTRDTRIVHELDGILAEVRPATLLRTGTTLWEAWSSHPRFTPSDLLLGLEVGGILPTIAVALASNLPYRLAWKLDLDLPDKRRFAEPHARRNEVFTYGGFRGVRVLIIDDEVTTGNTLSNLVTMLRDANAVVTGIACLVEDTAGDARRRLESLGIPLCTLTRL